MNTISIDCGASFIKGALFSEGKIVDRKDFSTPSESSVNDVFYTDKVENIIKGVKAIIDYFLNDQKEINICISNEMHGFILAYEDDTPYTGYVSWQKEFGSIKLDDLSSVDILSGDEFCTAITRTGMNLRAGLPSSNLLYLLRSGKLSGKKLYFFTLGDYIIKRIFGKDCVCSESNAAATGLYDLVEKKWNEKLTGLFNDCIVFPEVGNKVLSVVVDGVKYNVFPAIGDYQAALLGAGIEKPTDISFNLGTGAQVSIISDSPSFSKDYQILPFFDGSYLRRIPHLPSGRALNVYFRFIKDTLRSFDINVEDGTIWDVFNSSVLQALPNEMLCSMSFFENPVETRTKGKIDNIGEYDLTFPNLIKLVYDQVANNFIWAADNIVNPDSVERIIFSGGIARRIAYIREKIIGHYDSGIEVVENSDETLLGLYKYSLIDLEQ